MKSPAVYMLASQRNGTLYIGVTSDLIKRVWQHREGLADGFTKKYGVKMLVWYEQHETLESAISKEKTMKKWLRKWKLSTIEQRNPNWIDLWAEITGETTPPVVPSHPRECGGHAGTQEVETASVVPMDAANGNAATALDSRVRGNDEGEVEPWARSINMTALFPHHSGETASVVPAQAGTQNAGTAATSSIIPRDENSATALDSRIRGNDEGKT